MNKEEPDPNNEEESSLLQNVIEVIDFSRRETPRKDEIRDKEKPGESKETPLTIDVLSPIETTASLVRDWFDRWSIRISALTLIGLFFTVLFTYCQWQTMNRTLHEIQIQTTATQDAALGTVSSAATARQTLEIDQRPYLVADSPTFVVNGSDFTPKVGGGVEAQFIVRNIGKTPAKSYFVSYHLYLYTAPPLAGRMGEDAERFLTKDVTRYLDAKFVDIQRVLEKAKKSKSVWTGGGDLAPSVTAAYDSNKEPQWTPIRISDESEFRKLRTAESLLLYIGKIEYGDTFGKTRATEFCFRYFGSAQTGAWHACEWGHNIIE